MRLWRRIFAYYCWGECSSAGYVVFGRGDGAPVDLEEVAEGRGGFEIRSPWYSSVAVAGDVNGDGLSDLLIGSGGASYVIFGRRR